MHRRRTVYAIALIFGIALSALNFQTDLYLQRGYSLVVTLSGQPAAISRFEFPVWRIGLHLLLWIAALVALALIAAERRAGAALAWFVFCASLAVAGHDVWRYGTLGSPSSIWALLLLLLFPILAKMRQHGS